MTFTPADKKRIKEIENKLRDVGIPPSNGDEERSFPNDIAGLIQAQEALNNLVAQILMRFL